MTDDDNNVEDDAADDDDDDDDDKTSSNNATPEDPVICKIGVTLVRRINDIDHTTCTHTHRLDLCH